MFFILILGDEYVEFDVEAPLLNLEFPEGFIERFQLEPTDLKYNTVPDWVAQNQGNFCDWQCRHDPAFLLFCEEHLDESELCNALSRELRVACTKHLYREIEPAVQECVSDVLLARGLISTLSNRMIGNLARTQDEERGKEFIAKLSTIAYPNLDGQTPNMKNLRAVLDAAQVPTGELTLKRDLVDAYTRYCHQFDLTNELTVEH